MELRGLNLDSRPNVVDEGTWVFGKNIQISDDGKSIRNEEGFSINFSSGETGFIIIGAIVANKDIIVFSTNDTYSKILRVTPSSVTTILRTQYLGFDKTAPIEGVFKYDYNGDLIVAWWSGKERTSPALNAERPCILNLDTLPFDVDGNKEIDISSWSPGGGSVTAKQASELARMFPRVKIPYYDSIALSDGGNIDSATYYFTIAYGFNNYDFTSSFLLSQPAYVYGKNREYVDINDETIYGLLSENSGKKLTLTISNIDSIFDKIRICVIKRTESSIEANEVGVFNIEGGDFTLIYNGQKKEEIDWKELVIPRQTFENIHTGTVKDNRLIVANVKKNNFDFQPYANGIVTNFKVGALVLNPFTNMIGTDGTDISSKGLTPNEVYAFYVHLLWKDGTISQGFHIPGRVAGNYAEETGDTVSETEDMSNYTVGNYAGASIPATAEELLISNTKVFHLRDTSYYSDAPTNAVGKFAYWENENEVYPECSSFDGSVTGSDITGQKVRHHKTPCLERLNDFNGTGTYNGDIRLTVYPEFDNIVIPASIADKVDGVVFSYAKRTFKNSTVLGMSPIIAHDWSGIPDDYIRFYDFALLKKKPNISPTYLKSLGYKDDTSTTITPPNISLADLDIYEKRMVEFIDSHKYLPENNSLCLPATIDADGNKTREDTLFIEIDDTPADGNDMIMDNDVSGGNEWKLHLALLMTFKTDVYYPYYNQELCFTNAVKIISGAGTYNNVEGYGYDTFLTNNIFSITNDDYASGTSAILSTGALTFGERYRVIDPGYIGNENISRQDDEQAGSITLQAPTDISADFTNVGADMSNWRSGYEFVAKDTDGVGGGSASPTNWGKSQLVQLGGVVINNVTYSPYNLRSAGQIKNDLREIPAFRLWDYKDHYHYLNDLGVPAPFNPYLVYVEDFPNTIFRSVVQGKENISLKWRTFLTNEYYIMDDISKGPIWKLNSDSNYLYINQFYSLFLAATKDSIIVGDKLGGEFEAYLGQTDIFERPPREFITTKEGFAGCQSKFATLMTQYGYIFVDRDQAKVFLFDGQQIHEISDSRIESLLRSQMSSPTITTNTTDNPYNTYGMLLGYNPKIDTLYLVNNYGVAKDYTISYNLKYKYWICYHDWLPEGIFNTRNQMYVVSNFRGVTTKEQIYKTNVINKQGEYIQNSAGNIEVQYSFVDLVFNNPKDINKLYMAIMMSIDSLASSGVLGKEECVDKIMVYNDYQCSDYIDINTSQTWLGSGNISKSFDNWIFNDFKDAVVNTSAVFLDADKEPNSNVDASSKEWYELSNFISKYLVVRLLITNSRKRDMYINNVSVNTKAFKI